MEPTYAAVSSSVLSFWSFGGGLNGRNMELWWKVNQAEIKIALNLNTVKDRNYYCINSIFFLFKKFKMMGFSHLMNKFSRVRSRDKFYFSLEILLFSCWTYVAPSVSFWFSNRLLKIHELEKSKMHILKHFFSSKEKILTKIDKYSGISWIINFRMVLLLLKL